jgi:hypothetical protein
MTLDEMPMKKRNEIIKWTGFALSAIPPVILVCIFIFSLSSDIGMALIHVLWCGLYGSILLWWSHESRVLKWIMPVLNLPAFAFVALGAMMGGIKGLLIVILKTVIWYVPWITLLG